MTKDEAQRVALARWRALPPTKQTLENSAEFAKLLVPALEFYTLGNRELIIKAWLVRAVQARNDDGG